MVPLLSANTRRSFHLISLIAVGFVLLHALIHTLGFLKAFALADIPELTQHITPLIGVLWLCAGVLFVAAALLIAAQNPRGWGIALVAVILSQMLIFASWKDSLWGSIPNLLILLVTLSALSSIRFEAAYRRDVEASLARVRSLPAELLTESDLQALPTPVQSYLRYVGAVGKPKVTHFYATLSGQMRDKGKAYFPFTAEQYNFYDQPARLFFMKGKLFGMTVPGYHRYVGQTAVMDVRLFGLVSVMKMSGDAAFKADTVTLFNDMCLFAPASLIDPRIRWQTLDALTVQATFSNHGVTISATLCFNAQGELVNFVSQDRIAAADLKSYPWSTPISRYGTFEGYRLPAYGEAVWHYPEGDFVYGKMEIQSVVYQVRQMMTK